MAKAKAQASAQAQPRPAEKGDSKDWLEGFLDAIEAQHDTAHKMLLRFGRQP